MLLSGIPSEQVLLPAWVFGYVKARQAKKQSAVLPVTMPRPDEDEEEAHKK